MRKPHEYVSAAMAKLRNGSLSGCSEVMRHDGRSAAVTRVGTSGRGGDAVSETGVEETCRVLADVAAFPSLQVGEAVELGASVRIVTSCDTGPANALLSVGMSAPMDSTRAIYSGTRREDGTVHNFRHTVDILCIRSASEPPELSDAAGYSCKQTWLAALAVGAWPELTDPRPSDLIEFTDPKRTWETVRLRVSSVVRHDGWWILRARPRGGV